MTPTISLLTDGSCSDVSDADVAGLAAVLVNCVDGGASVGFLAPLTRLDAEAWWHSELASPAVRTWVARDEDGTVVGCVRLTPAGKQNAPHRAEVSKLLVSSAARRTGCATALMSALESWAAAHGRTLLLLDTQTGSPAQNLYSHMGWRVFGVVDSHALTPSGVLADTTYMLKHLDARTAAR